MYRLFLTGASILVLGLAAWQSHTRVGGEAALPVPAYFGGIHPRISPDGSSIAFSYQGAIWRAARDGGPMTRLTDGPGFDSRPVWSPDGKNIAYNRSPGTQRSEVRLIDAVSGTDVPMAARVELSGNHVEFHPDGRLLGALRIDGGLAGWQLIDLATGQTQPMVRPHTEGMAAPFAVSHDGHWLAYVSTRDVAGQQEGNDGPQADLWKVEISGGEPTRVTRFPARIFDLCWSADDRALFVVSDLGGAYNDLWRVPVADPGRGARQITFGQADEASPSISADGRWLAYSDNRQGPTALMVRDLHNETDATIRLTAMDFGKPVGRVRLQTRNQADKAAVAARVSIRHTEGKYYAPAGALYRRLGDECHFYCDGTAELTLPAGRYLLRAFRGPEYRKTSFEFSVKADGVEELNVDLERWAHPAERGWYSGENHIHANYGYGEWYNSPETMRLQCAGEDLRVCNFVVANSDSEGIFDRQYFRGRADPLSTPETILYWNQEFRSTFYGHMTLVNLSRLVEPIMTGFKDTTNPWDVPTNADIADRVHLQQGLVNFTHAAVTTDPDDPYAGPYSGKSLPVDAALGKIDSVDLNRRYVATIPLWYRLLNCGFRLPASAGTDCFLNRIVSILPGGDRVYVKIDGDFSYASWIEGLRAGRSFVSNGPMLDLVVEGQGPGGVVRLAKAREVRVVGAASSLHPLATLELVYNGTVVASGRVSEDGQSAALEQPIEISHSGWLSLRAEGKRTASVGTGFPQAHTSAVYVEVADRPTASREDAEYFLKWIERLSVDLRRRDRIPSLELKRHVESQFESARQVYLRLACESP